MNIEKIMTWVKDRNSLTYIKSFVLLAYFAIISAMEYMAFKGNKTVTVIASRVWLAVGVLLFCAFLARLAYTFVLDIKNKRFFIIFFWGLLLVFYGFMIFSIAFSDVNPDATQQVAAGLNSFHQADWNYTGKAFLGYANRQYIIAAIPSLLFGRSIATLHMGFGVPFIIGLTELFLEIRKWLQEKKLNENYALIPAFTFFGFRFIIEYYMNFEQAITPVALTMLGIAIFLRTVRKMDVVSAVSLAWIGVMCVNSYTPVLASLGLLVVFILFRIVEICINGGARLKHVKSYEISSLIAYVGILLNIGASLASSILAGRSDRINVLRDDVTIFQVITEAIPEFFTDENACFWGIFMGAVIFYMILSVLGQLRFRDFLLTGWMLCVVVFANYLKGYTGYSKAWILQRNMIVIPVFVTALFFTIMRILMKFRLEMKHRYMAIYLVTLLVLGCVYSSIPHQSFTYFAQIKAMKYMLQNTADVCKEQEIKVTDEINLVFYTTAAFQRNLQDYSKFLFPNAHIYMPDIGKRPTNVDYSLPTIVIGDKAEQVALYSSEIRWREFKDRRYNMKHSWFTAVLE